jgi:hypothetical protein
MEEIKIDDIDLYEVGNSIQIAGTIWSGNGLSFITLFPGKTEDFANLKLLPMDLTDWERFIRQTDLLETEIFGTDPHTGKLIKSVVRKTARQIDSYTQWAVFKRDNYSCRYCGRTGIPLTVDHIDLWEDGGPTIELNLVSACRSCNKDRGRIKFEDWITSPVYGKKSRHLSEEQKKLNLDILDQLVDIRSKRVKNIRTR